MAERMFESLNVKESRPLVFLRRAALAFLALCSFTALVSGHRLTPELLSRFREGAAVLRATATGRPQWMRLPPPTVRETAVEIRRE